jgi:hypothetical protein
MPLRTQRSGEVFVGWVERSDTHDFFALSRWVSLRSTPSYFVLVLWISAFGLNSDFHLALLFVGASLLAHRPTLEPLDNSFVSNNEGLPTLLQMSGRP